MYHALDSFLALETWPSRHYLDIKRFHIALNKIINDPKFSPEHMGEYIEEKVGIDLAESLKSVIEQYVMTHGQLKNI